jgi:hypothetical protein
MVEWGSWWPCGGGNKPLRLGEGCRGREGFLAVGGREPRVAGKSHRQWKDGSRLWVEAQSSRREI